MAEIIASSTAGGNSADFTLAAGESTTIFLKAAAGTAIPPYSTSYVQIKSGTQYFTVGTLDGRNPAQVLTAVGTFRVSKDSAPVAFGVDRN